MMSSDSKNQRTKIALIFISSFLPGTTSSILGAEKSKFVTAPFPPPCFVKSFPRSLNHPVKLTLTQPPKTSTSRNRETPFSKPQGPENAKNKIIQKHEPPNHFRIPFLSYFLEVMSDAYTPYKLSKRYGPIYTTDIFGQKRYVVTTTELCMEVLRDAETYKSKNAWPKQVYDLIGHHMFNEDGELLTRNRMILGQAFRGNMLRYYFQAIKRQFEQYWETKGRENAWEPLDKLLKENTFRVIAHMTLGEEGETMISIDYLRKLFDDLAKGVGYPVLPFDLGPSGKGKEANRILSRLVGRIVDRTSNEKKDLLDRVAAHGDGDDDGNHSNKRELQSLFKRGELSFITKILSEVDVTTREEKEYLVTTIVFFWVAGIETTAATLASAFYELSIRPKLLKRLRKEQDELVKRYNSKELEYNQLEEMPLLTAFMYEVLRKWLTGTTAYRQTTKDTTLAGYKISKGSYVAADLQSTMFDSRHYKDPETFDVSRFLPLTMSEKDTIRDEKHKKPMVPQTREPLPALAFGAGPHHCIGHMLAKIEFRALVAMLLREYQWDIRGRRTGNKNFVMLPTLHPEGLEMRVRAMDRSV